MSDRFFQYARITVMSDLFPSDGTVGEYVSNHLIEADIEGIWDRTPTERFHYHGSSTGSTWELMKWNVLAIYLDGIPLSHPNDVPRDFPMREVMAALEAGETAQQLRDEGPNR